MSWRSSRDVQEIRAAGVTRGAGVALVCFAAALSACEAREGGASGAEPSDVEERARNFVLVVVDTLRADHTSLYGYARETTPELTGLAQDAVVFENAFSAASCTFPSVNSLLTSRPPQDFVRGEPLFMGIPSEVPSLAKILSAAGFQTVAVSASPIVSAEPTDLNPDGGFGGGFEVFDARCLWRRGACVNRRVRRHLEARDSRPLFLYVHFMDPHGPYSPVPDRFRRFAGAAPGLDEPERLGVVADTAARWYGPEREEPSAAVLEHFVDLYDDEIVYTDFQIGALLDALRDQDLFRDSLIVVTADHGEEFFEHRDVGHCRNVYDTQVGVPLVVWSPGARHGRRVRAAVSLLDVMPTALDLLGLDVAGGGQLPFEGSSLAPAVLGRDLPDDRIVFAWQSGWAAAVSYSDKLMARPGQAPRLYSREHDPGEQENLLHDGRPEAPAFERLRAELRAWSTRFERTSPDRLERHLEALGYLQ